LLFSINLHEVVSKLSAVRQQFAIVATSDIVPREPRANCEIEWNKNCSSEFSFA